MPSHPLEADTWLFDLDNTLYSHRYDLFSGVSVRMTQFIVEKFSIPHDEAKAMQTKYFRELGTTLLGLMIHHDIDPEEFLEYVHDIDYSPLPPNPALNALLDKLPQRKIIFTNGSTAHALSVIRQLGIDTHFHEFFDITDADYIPKPKNETYDKLVTQFGLEPQKTLMIEDIAINLKYPKTLGMQTVFIHTNEDWAKPDPSDANYIDHETHDLTEWIEGVLA